EDGIRDYKVTGVQTCALPISETDAFQLPLMSRARLQRDDEHHQVCQIGCQVVVEESVVGDLQKATHDLDAVPAEAKSAGVGCSAGSVPVRSTSSKLFLAWLLKRLSAASSASN